MTTKGLITGTNLLAKNGQAFLIRDAFSDDESKTLMQFLLEDVPWKQEPIVMFGKKIMQPRMTAWYGNPGVEYRYSGITMIPTTWSDCMLQVKQRVEQTAGCSFNSALLNWYRDGRDSMGWHRDNEKSLGVNPTIASVSFGASRKFQIRQYADKSSKATWILNNGSLLLMSGETQHCWEHQVPKEQAILGGRINITFRAIIN